MAQILFKGNVIHTNGSLPAVGEKAKDFTLVRQDLSEAKLSDYGRKLKILNIFPSLDTGVCANSVRNFYAKIDNMDQLIVLNISKDLPFAANRFCDKEGLDEVETLSCFRSSFSTDYGLEITDGILKGLCSRAVLVLDGDNRIIYSEHVPEIAQEPNYEKVLEVINT